MLPCLAQNKSSSCKKNMHAHNVAFEKSDLFFICMLRPLSSRIIVDEHEIEAAKVFFIVQQWGYLCTLPSCSIWQVYIISCHLALLSKQFLFCRFSLSA
ncbi:hypothetical protein RIF29_06568 [Crotalaria pallida]|uniref:Uncharacterized protein n=1 Tax=Crotalaria pallida TaxID=3830 RepID=A0AAN9J4G2_CROPI